MHCNGLSGAQGASFTGIFAGQSALPLIKGGLKSAACPPAPAPASALPSVGSPTEVPPQALAASAATHSNEPTELRILFARPIMPRSVAAPVPARANAQPAISAHFLGRECRAAPPGSARTRPVPRALSYSTCHFWIAGPARAARRKARSERPHDKGRLNCVTRQCGFGTRAVRARCASVDFFGLAEVSVRALRRIERAAPASPQK